MLHDGLTISRDPHNPLVPRIQQYVERMMRTRAELLDDSNRKRPLAEPPRVSEAKRLRVEGPAPIIIKALPPGPHTLAGVFNVTNDVALQNFDASQIPLPIAISIIVKSLANTTPVVFDQYSSVSATPACFLGYY